MLDNLQELTRHELDSWTVGQLDRLLLLCKHTSYELERLPGIVIKEGRLSDDMSSIKIGYMNKMNVLTKSLEKGQISILDFDKKSHEIIGNSFTQSYKLNLKRKMNGGDIEYVGRATQEEMKYMRSFGRDVKNNKLKLSRVKRVGMYSQTLDGIGWHAQVESQPDNVRIDWVLGRAEHCDDCILLAANSPYTKFNLPTTPKVGGTVCLSNCKCKLRFKKGVLSSVEREDMIQYSAIKDQGLKDILAMPKVPKGMRYPSINERKYIDDLRHRLNYQRRLIGDKTTRGRKLLQAIAERKRINEELVDYTMKNDIYEIPVFSVDDVLDERYVSRKAVNNLFAYSIDGRTIDLLDDKTILSMLNEHYKIFSKEYSTSNLKKNIIKKGV